MRKVLAAILGGGRGTRLFPLTKYRSKPAVPLGGKYRLIDITISNCLNSNINKVFILTQFNSLSLNKHINHTYKFDNFREGFVDIIAAEQRIDVNEWFQGTADAIRKSLHNFKDYNIDDILILSGDHLYAMDYEKMLDFHRENNADITISVKPVDREKAKGFGVLKANSNKRITKFVEKPQEEDLLDSLVIPELAEKSEDCFIASMGIYVFKLDVLIDLLEKKYPDALDFGKEIIPYSLGEYDVFSYFFDGYWEDIGTIKSFYHANLDFINEENINLYDSHQRTYTHARFLPGSIMKGDCKVTKSIINEGAKIENAEITNSIIGIRANVKAGTKISNSLIMGNDFYEDESEYYNIEKCGDQIPSMGVGENCEIHNAILDKNVRMGNNVIINPKEADANYSGDGFMVRDGITVIEKNAIIPDNTVI